MAILAALVLTVFAHSVGRHVQIGDLQPGAPELLQNSQYNKDNSYIIQHYMLSTDQIVMLVDVTAGWAKDAGSGNRQRGSAFYALDFPEET